jgi:RimJ/RimL family protein N-acetyltransferase
MLLGDHVGLRAIERADLPVLLAWRNQPEFRRYFREYRELSGEHQNRWFENVVMGDCSTRMFAIEDLAAGRLLGACGLCYIDWVNRNADFSIYIGADGLYIDELYALDAARVMARYGFDELGLHRLWAEIYDFDTSKSAFFERLGFSLEGRHRQTHWSEGRWHDSFYYSLLAHETLK